MWGGGGEQKRETHMGQTAQVVARGASEAGQQAVLLACLAHSWAPRLGQNLSERWGQVTSVPARPCRASPRIRRHVLLPRGGGGGCSALPSWVRSLSLLGGTGCCVCGGGMKRRLAHNYPGNLGCLGEIRSGSHSSSDTSSSAILDPPDKSTEPQETHG